MKAKSYLSLQVMLVLILGVGVYTPGFAAEAATILQHYHELIANVQDNPFGAPLSVHSKDDGDIATAEVYGVLDKPFTTVADVLGNLSAWCQFMPLSLNIKACTWTASPAGVTLYIGPKEYHAPTDFKVSKVHFTYRVSTMPEQIRIELNTASGATGTKTNTILVEALSATQDQTMVHFVSTTEFTYTGRLAMNAYLSTMGSNRIGFSTTDDEGQHVPIKGIKGVVERNAMRYYLALQAYIEQRSIPGNDLLERSANQWFELTERYPRQLHELDKGVYLETKRHEYMNQTAMHN